MIVPPPDPDTIFAELLQDLPPATVALAREFQAFTRARKIKTPEQLLRAVLLYAALDHSAREVAANLVLVDPELKSLSDQAVHERLRACEPWLQALLPRLLRAESLPNLPADLRLLVVDGSAVTAPGETTVSWRLHVVLDLVTLRLVSVHLTERRPGESLKNFAFAPSDVVLTDRGYCHPSGVESVLAQGAQFILRYYPHRFPLTDLAGQPLDLEAALVAVLPGETTTLKVTFERASGARQPLWLHVYRLPGPVAAEARRRCRRAAKREGRQPKTVTLFLAEFVLVLTSVPPELLAAETVLQLYRCRWQVELLLKRWKSLLSLDQVRARVGSALGRVYLLGKLLYAGLLERRASRRGGAGWTSLIGPRQGTWWRLWKLIQREVEPLISLAVCWQAAGWPAALTSLSERKRRRRLQQLPSEVVIWLEQPSQTSERALPEAA